MSESPHGVGGGRPTSASYCACADQAEDQNTPVRRAGLTILGRQYWIKRLSEISGRFVRQLLLTELFSNHFVSRSPGSPD